MSQKSRARLDSNKTRVQVLKNGQFMTTIPKALANAMKLDKDSILEFEMLKQGGIKIKTWYLLKKKKE